MKILEPMSPQEEAAKIRQLEQYLTALRLPFLFAALENRLPSFDAQSEYTLDLLLDVFGSENQRRINARIEAASRKAHLKYPDAVADELLQDPERHLDQEVVSRLVSCNWIDEHCNAIITGLTGSGKTYLACAVASIALARQKTVRYIRASSLLQEFSSAADERHLAEQRAAYANFDLLIIDDFGLMKVDLNACADLFELIEARDLRKSTVVISQYPVSDWYALFANATYADAILDRLVHGAIRLEMQGRNMRLASHSQAQQQNRF